MGDLYAILTFIYFIIAIITWAIKSEDYFTKDIGFKDLFRVYDLGCIIFPISIIGAFAGCIISLLWTLAFNENKRMSISFLNKKLFKDKSDN